MRADKVREIDSNDLKRQLTESREQMFRLRFQMAMRKMPLTESEAPASASQTSASGSDDVSPKSVMPIPQAVAARITPQP